MAEGKGDKAAGNPSAPRPYLNSKGKDLVSLVNLIWRQGIRPAYRWQFWRQLLGIYRHNPSRLKTYLISCAMGENFFLLREEILQKGVPASWPEN